jgi:hypothetical protein
LRNPDITHLEVVDENVATPRDRPVAGRFRVPAIAEAAFLAYKRQTGKSFIINGERGGNRTCNLLIKSQLLCQLSYAPILLKRLDFDAISTTRAELFIASNRSNAVSNNSGDGCTYR